MIVFVTPPLSMPCLTATTPTTRLPRKYGLAYWAVGDTLFTHNYVLLEATALLQHRLGVAAVRAFSEDVVPLLAVDWVAETQHRAGLEAMLAAGRKKLSLVDCVSFQSMRANGVRTAFCFDAYFAEQGFSHPAVDGP